VEAVSQCLTDVWCGVPPQVQITSVAFQVAPEFTGWHAAVLQQLSSQYGAITGPPAAAQEALRAIPAALAAHPSLAGMPEAKLRAQARPAARPPPALLAASLAACGRSAGLSHPLGPTSHEVLEA